MPRHVFGGQGRPRQINTGLEDRFIEEFLIDLNQTQAAIRAGCKPKNAANQGSVLMKRPRVADAIAVAKAERSKRTGINQDRAIQEAASMGLVKITDICRWGGKDGLVFVPSDQLSDFDARAIVKVTQTEKFIKKVGGGRDGEPEEMLMSREMSIELAKPKALEYLLRHTGAIQTGQGGNPGQGGAGAPGEQPAAKAYCAEDWDRIPS